MIKCVFIDMDNTIAENTTCDDVSYYPGLYLNKRPIQVVIDAIKYLYPDSLYIVISQTDGGISGYKEKNQWLDIYFPDTFIRSLIPKTDKKENLIQLHLYNLNIKPEEALLIDDKKIILQSCKRLGINVKYPQQIICDYEERRLSYDIHSLHSL